MATGTSPSDHDRGRRGKGKPRAVGSLYSKEFKPYRYGEARSDNPILPEGFKEPTAAELKAYESKKKKADK